MTTAATQIYGALRLCGILAEGETPSSETAANGLTAFNQWLDADSINRGSVFALQDQPFSWIANTASRTLGPSGTLGVGTRPIALDASTYFVDTTNSISFGPIPLVDAEVYNTIASKTQTSTYPDVLWVNMTMPDITLTVYPVPTIALTWHFMSVIPLTQPALLSTALSVPPGYLRYFRYNLAVELASEFGVEAPPDVRRIAAQTMRSIKRINKPDMSMGIPYGLSPVINHDIISGT